MTLMSVHENFFLLLDCLVQTLYDDIYLALLNFVMHS